MSIDTTIERAIRFLLYCQHPDGWWADFQLAAGPSNVWVTAYIGLVLARQENTKAREAAARAWHWLSERESLGGWGYNVLTPCDADSTLWALQLAEAVGAVKDISTKSEPIKSEPTKSQSVENGYRFLKQHVRPGGGVTTYASEREIRAFVEAPASVSFRGWCEPQVCVTAAAGGIDELTAGACEFLRESQSLDGRWHSYWWCEDEYATTLAVVALQKQNNPEDTERIESAINWAIARLDADGWVSSFLYRYGSPFATAWIIYLLSISTEPQTVKDAIEKSWRWLQAQQKPNGSWSGSASLRVPPPDLQDPQKYEGWKLGRKIEGGISLDQNGLFTTATVLEALSQLKNKQLG